jgi:fatty-acyl-CoA synthase
MRTDFEVYSPTEANFVPLSPVSFLARAADVYANRTATVFEGTRRSWAEVGARVQSVATGLRGMGVDTGEVVAVFAPNSPAVFELHFAVPATGGVLCTINTRLEPETVAYILDHSAAKVVIVDARVRPVLDAALKMADSQPDVVEIANVGSAVSCGYEALAMTPADLFLTGPADEWQAITLNYTSGTSGKPKGVIYHHRGAYLMALGTVAGWQVPQAPSYLSVVPLFHCNGWGHPWMMAIMGGKVTFTHSPDAASILVAIKDEQVTHFGAAPVILQMLAENSDQTRFDPPVQAMTAGAPPPPAVLEKTAAMGMDVMHVYGLTETYGHISQALWDRDWDSLDVSTQADYRARQGVAFPMVENVAVINRDTGQPVPRDGITQGEIAIRGNTVMKGYLGNTSATEDAFEGGWFWSGDAAVVHPDGHMQIRDRLKDVIISGGENVSSVEVEAVLYRHPDVATAAVVAKPDVKWGEVPCAFIELREGADPDADALIAFCRSHLAGFKTPKHIIFTEIPKTATGKVQKFLLRALAKEG